MREMQVLGEDVAFLHWGGVSPSHLARTLAETQSAY